MISPSCLFCHASETEDIFLDGSWPVRRCLGCGHVFSSYQGQEDFSAYFSEDVSQENHFWWRDAHARLYRFFRRKFMWGRSGRLLDVGCGLGYFLAGARDDQDCSAWSLAGVETSLPASRFASSVLGLKSISHGSLVSAAYPDNHFDLITLWDVLEHLPDPWPVLREIRRILKDGGQLFLATPNIDIQLPKARLKKFFKAGQPGHYLEARDHLHNYSPRTLRRLLEESGFQAVDFLMLPPITSVSGRQSWPLAMVKEVWHQLAKVFFNLSLGRVNLNNLYVSANK